MTRAGSTFLGVTPSLSVKQKNKDQKYTTCLWNSRSIVNKLRCFQSFIYAHDYSFIVLTETWLHDYIYNNELIPSGYTIYRKDRNSKGGGVLVAVKSIFKSIQLTSPDNLEVVAVTVHAHHSFTICAVYIPPNSTRAY